MNIIWTPNPKQIEFMRRWEDEALYGGAAGGGKSDALVAEALRQVHIPHYKGLIIRKTFPQLAELVDKTLNYYTRAFPKAVYNSSRHCWRFPSGSMRPANWSGNPWIRTRGAPPWKSPKR